MAGGDTIVCFLPQHAEPPLATYGTMDVRDALNTTHPVLDLALNEYVAFSFIMPQSYSGNGVEVYYHYAMTSAVANDIKLEGDFERIGDGQQDLDSDGYTGSPQNTGDITVPGTSGLTDIVYSSHADGAAQMDSLAAGEGGRLKVKRIAVAGTDAAGDLELRFVEIREQADP